METLIHPKPDKGRFPNPSEHFQTDNSGHMEVAHIAWNIAKCLQFCIFA
jgi:hypothetical protein